MKIIIPGREGSKGLPLKNRKLFKHTADIIPDAQAKNVWVTTNDKAIIKLAKSYNFNIITRPDELSGDTVSIREVIVHALNEAHVSPDELVLMLYLTYPEREWSDVDAATSFFFEHYTITDSLLCRKEIKTSPYLYLQEHGVNGLYGKQLRQHDLYRRQDYPKCFEISHYICLFKAFAINKLNKNMYNETTVFFPIDNPIDVDTKNDLDEFKKS